jgi:L-ascorbate metabolism protein UlaG (beta-lactamase superfamily)
MIKVLLLGVIMSMLNANEYPTTDHYKEGKFLNEEITYVKVDFSKLGSMISAFMFDKSKEATPTKEIPIVKLNSEMIDAMHNNSVIRLSHSTLLLKLDGNYFLTDPLFSERASPVSFMGPKRFHPSPINIEGLPTIKGVILSHDHYDHFDYEALQKLDDKVVKFYTPLGVGKRLIEMGIDANKVVEQDWWESINVDGVELITTPAQHFSGRGVFDSDTILWASWVIKTDTVNLFFSGDSGYFTGFKSIAKKYGPFDMTFIEVGAYNTLWREIHMLPYKSVQAHIDLDGAVMFPVHNGTFDLALHSWYEPFDKVLQSAQEKAVTIRFPKMGEELSLLKPKETSLWWRE